MSKAAAIAAQSRPPVNRLTLRQQPLLDSVISDAQRKPGGHVHTARNGWSYWARQHANGRTRWTVRDEYGSLIALGETS